MGWERRGNGAYYYRATKVDGRVVKEYVGAGPLAELAARHDAERRAARAAEAAAQCLEHGRLAAIDAAVDAAHGAVETVLRASLVAAGYRLHRRGEWRRRRRDA